MANRFSFIPSGYILSSSLGDISISTDDDFVDVKLFNIALAPLLSERFYTFAGKVTIHDLASLIESDMRTLDESFRSYTLQVINSSGSVDDSITLNIVYCERIVCCDDSDDYLRNNFLSTINHRRIPWGADISASYFAAAGENINSSVCCYWRNRSSGEELMNSVHLSSAIADKTGIYSVSVVSQHLIDAIAACDGGHEKQDIEILSVNLFCGNRMASFFFDRSLKINDTFYFRNMFNVLEPIVLPFVSTAKSEVERSLAVLIETSQFYNRSISKAFEVVAGPLSSDEAYWIDQFLCSHSVFRVFGAQALPVLITEASCEISNSDDKPNTVKFTWRLALNRPAVILNQMSSIFSAHFNHVFS